MPADKAAVDIKLGNGIRCAEFYIQPFPKVFIFIEMYAFTVTGKTPIVILTALTYACPAAYAVLVVPCVRERDLLPCPVRKIRFYDSLFICLTVGRKLGKPPVAVKILDLSAHKYSLCFSSFFKS